MSHPKALACPKCGGPLAAAAATQVTTCTFCGATAAPPPRTVDRVVERVVERVIVADDVAAAALPRCPRCNRALEDVRSVARVVGVCTRCGGTWVDKDTAHYLARVDDPELARAARQAAGVVRSVPLREKHATVFCPVCKTAARRIEVMGTVHVVDVCDDHGTWFDCDEMAGFMEAFTAERAGPVTDEDLGAAGVGGPGFLSRVFRTIFS